MKKGCKLLPKISGLKEYEAGGNTSNLDGTPGAPKRKRQPRQPRPNKLRGEKGKHIFHKQ